ncbi:MAG: histidine ammonia-lyase, partial [Flexivirga sp.]
MSETVVLGVGALSIGDVVAVARRGALVEISEESLAEVGRRPPTNQPRAHDPLPPNRGYPRFGARAPKHNPAPSR